jgi:predicted RNA methylase
MPSFVNFIPTQTVHIEAFFELVSLSASDVVYDLGSGDGRLLFAALEKGAGRAVGIELDPDLVRDAREIGKKKGVQDRITFLIADITDVKLNDASVVLCYLTPYASAALKMKLVSELRSGSKVVMEMFPVSGWKPVKTICKEGKQFYLYNMPPEISDEIEVSDPLLDYLNYRSTP